MIRKTIKNQVELNGIGLHSGKEVNLQLLPAEAGYGIKFLRSDVEGASAILADINNVSNTNRSTSLNKGDIEIGTVEHLLSALYGNCITDIQVVIDGPEIPILDGSAMPFVKLIQEAGINYLEKEVEDFKIVESFNFKDEDSGAEYFVMPSENFEITVMIDFEGTPIQGQFAEIKSLESYNNSIADARTFVMAKDILKLSDEQLIKGGDLSNAIVIADKNYSQEEVDKIARALGRESTPVTSGNVFNLEGLRYKNEPARHKLLDFIGDFSLLGVGIKGKIICRKPGHSSNIKFVQQVKQKYLEWRKIKGKPFYDENKEPVLDLEGLKALLPHRYPFLLVDKIIEITDSLVVGVKNVTFNEGFFQGHFPDNPVFPGVLQMEALAQTGGILALKSVEDPENWDTYFLKMDNVKFKNKVVPGDTLILKMELLSPIRRGIVHMKGTTFVGNKIVSEGELIAQIIRRS